ncbi:MAG: Slp family lipoprotein [Candidatus Desulfofervidus auxilii]|nr:Slp family lipoprotein [Candidatus Desulfofervidus auxilii]
MRIYIIIFILCLFSCTQIVPSELKQKIKDISIYEVQKNPEIFKSKVVMWGGKILKGINKKEGTLLEILALPLDRQGRPKQTDKSEGRFLILYDGYLDVAIYSQGREITVIGEIEGIKKLPLGEIEYPYPILKVRKIHLWKPQQKTIKIYHHWFPYPYYPWWLYYP